MGERHQRAKARGTEPYFLRDNPKYTAGKSPTPKPEQSPTPSAPATPPKPSIAERAQARHNARTPEQIAEIQKRWDERNKRYRKHLQNEARAKFAGTQVPTAIGSVTITNTSIKEFINQPHAQYRLKNELARKLDQVIKDATYIGQGDGKHEGQYRVHLFEILIQGRPSWLIVRENKAGELQFYSISDKRTR